MGDVFYACKSANLRRLRLLVEQIGCQINVTDKWNSTPLYHACLVGNEEIVRYLLENGAKLEAFNLERCINCALSDGIVHLLRNPPAVRQRHQTHYKESMFMMYSRACDYYGDICLSIGHEDIRLAAHRAVLCKQSPYFTHNILGPNRGKSVLYFRHRKDSCVEAWLQILQFMYTGRVEFAWQGDLLKRTLHLSRRVGLRELTKALRGVIQPEKLRLGNTVTVDIECAAYPEFAEIALHGHDDQHGDRVRQPFLDLCVIVREQRFYCHKGFVVSRSPYFSALLDSDQFTEVTTSFRGGLTFLTLHNIQSRTFALLLKFIYTGTTEVNEETVEELLFYADHYMIYGLKSLCGEYIASKLDVANSVKMLSLSRLLRMVKLQNEAVKFIAYNYDRILDKQDFARLLFHDEHLNRRGREVRVSESSMSSSIEYPAEEEEEEEEMENEEEGGLVDIQMDMRLFLREITQLQNYTSDAEQRETRIVAEIRELVFIG